MNTHNYQKYVLKGKDFYNAVENISTEISWAISSFTGNFWDEERFTTSDECKDRLGDYVLEKEGTDTYLMIQVLSALPRIGEDIELTDLEENIFIPNISSKSNVDYFVNVILDTEGNADKILILDWTAFQTCQALSISDEIDQPIEDTENNTITLPLLRDFMSEDPAYVFPIYNCPNLTMRGKRTLDKLIVYKRGYN